MQRRLVQHLSFCMLGSVTTMRKALMMACWWGAGSMAVPGAAGSAPGKLLPPELEALANAQPDALAEAWQIGLPCNLWSQRRHCAAISCCTCDVLQSQVRGPQVRGLQLPSCANTDQLCCLTPQAADAAAEAAAAREEAAALAAAAGAEDEGSPSGGDAGNSLGGAPSADPSAFDAGNFGFFGQVRSGVCLHVGPNLMAVQLDCASCCSADVHHLWPCVLLSAHERQWCLVGCTSI